MYVTHRVQGLGSLFLVTRKGRCSASTGICSLGHSPPCPNYSRHWAFQGWEASFSSLSPPLLPQCFSAHFTQSNTGLLHRHSQHALSSPGFPLFDFTRVHVSPRDSAPPRSTYQRLLPTVSSLITPAFPAIAIHLRLLPSAPPPLLDKRPLPCSHRSYHPYRMRMARLW